MNTRPPVTPPCMASRQQQAVEAISLTFIWIDHQIRLFRKINHYLCGIGFLSSLRHILFLILLGWSRGINTNLMAPSTSNDELVPVVVEGLRKAGMSEHETYSVELHLNESSPMSTAWQQLRGMCSIDLSSRI